MDFISKWPQGSTRPRLEAYKYEENNHHQCSINILPYARDQNLVFNATNLLNRMSLNPIAAESQREIKGPLSTLFVCPQIKETTSLQWRGWKVCHPGLTFQGCPTPNVTGDGLRWHLEHDWRPRQAVRYLLRPQDAVEGHVWFSGKLEVTFKNLRRLLRPREATSCLLRSRIPSRCHWSRVPVAFRGGWARGQDPSGATVE